MTMIFAPRRTADTSAWAPPETGYTNNECQMIKLELPGARLGEIELAIDQDTLSVSGTCRAGRFLRCLPLSYRAPLEQIQLTMRDGQLWIRVPNPQYGFSTTVTRA
ncbi:MAG TPA: Hsp20/alpha crystallin family protein [Chloroflexota bacterium]|nr:Hsp20/alpha crystallin family protein [Chloroflexota bacterium]